MCGVGVWTFWGWTIQLCVANIWIEWAAPTWIRSHGGIWGTLKWGSGHKSDREGRNNEVGYLVDVLNLVYEAIPSLREIKGVDLWALQNRFKRCGSAI